MENKQRELLLEKYPEITEKEGALFVPSSQLLEVCQYLKGAGFDFLNALTAVDWPQNITVVYQIGSFEKIEQFTLKVELSKEEAVLPSVVGIWKGANWLEREVYDMFGILFSGHPKLERILLDDTFAGYPLRKDYVG